MKIGITGPISTESVRQFLTGQIDSLPKGMAGAPLLGTLISSLIERGHQVSAYTLDRDLPAFLSRPVAAEGKHGFRIFYGPYRRHSFRFNGRWPGRMVDFFRLERRLLEQMIHDDAPDIVHAHWAYEFALAAMATGKPYVVTCHDSPRQVLHYMPNLYRLGRYFMGRKVLGSAKLITAVSPYLLDEIQESCVVPVRVITNPIPFAILERAPYQRVPPALAPQIAAIVNGWSKRKNPETTLKAFALLHQCYPAAALHLFGYDFGVGEKAEAWASARGVQQGVVFHGATPHTRLLEQLESMDILLHTALEESFGVALIEAMALGLPVVGGERSGGVPWLLGGGNAGVLVDVSSPQDICEGMRKLIENPDFYTRISETAIVRVRTEFSPETVTAQYEKAYEEAIGMAMDKNAPQAA